MKTSLNNYEKHYIGLAGPEIISISVARVGECHGIKTEQISKKKPKKEIDIRNISTDDLKSIQRQDPFMYYSIPGVRSAKLFMKEIDSSNLGLNRNCGSCPSRLGSVHDNAPEPHKVTRSSCISFECHPDLLLEGLLDADDNGNILLDDVEDPLDWLMANLIE